MIQTLRQRVALFAALLISWSAFGQYVPNYTVSTSSGTYTPITTGTSFGTATNDDQSFADGANPTTAATGFPATGPGIDIGFDFVFNGQIMNKLGVNSNGFIALGYNGVTISSSYGGFTTTQNLVKGFNHDLTSLASGDIRVATVGSAPNRECVVQWTNYRKYNSTAGGSDTINFQIRLVEGSNNIALVYGKTRTAYTGTSYKPTVGICSSGAMLALGGTSWSTTPTTFATYSATNNLPFTATVAPDNGRTILLTAPTMCVAPAVTATTTTTSATLTFANGSTGTTYSIEYGPAPLTAGTGTVVSSATSPYTITGLTAATNYGFIVTANCGGSLTNATTLSAATQCVVISSFPYTESFEAAGWVLGNSAVPTCFSNTNTLGTTSFGWRPEDLTTPSTFSGTGPQGPQDGVKYVFLETSSGSTGSSAFLEFPEFNTTSLGTPQLKYFYHMFGATTGKLIVEHYNGTNWVGIDSLIGQQQTASASPWLDRVVNLPSAASVKIRFRGVRGTSFTGDISIDNVSIQQAPPSCPVTDTLTVTGGTSCGNSSVTMTASGASSTSTILWTNSSSEVVGTGSTLTTPVITATTSFSAAAFADDNSVGDVNFGPSDTLVGGFGNFTNGQWFTALAPFRLDSITVKSSGAATFALRVSEAGGSITTGNSGALLQQSQWISVPAAGTHKVFVGMYILPGSYYLNFTWQTGSGLLHRATGGAVYPYTAAGVATIDSVQFGTATSQSRVYYAYNWVVSKGCVGPTTTGTATWAAVPSTAIPYTVDFNGGLPCNWTASSNTNQNWNVVSTYGANSLNGSSFAFLDDDAAGGSAPAVDASLTSPIVSTLGYDSVTVSFDHYFYQYSGTAGYVEVYNGTSWVAIDTFTTTQGSWTAPATASYDVTSFANADFQVRLRYSDGTGTWGWYWAVDNFEIDGNVLPCTNVRVGITTDIYGSEVTWSIRDVNTGIVWATGGPYADVTPYNAAAATHVDTLCLPDNGTYEFQINDSYGDGLFDGTNTGTYTVDKLCSWGWNNVITGSGAQPYGSTTNPPSYDSAVFDMNCIQLKNVTFQVDMNQVTAGFTTPEVNGFWNNWCGNCNAMTDANGDGIWEVTIPLEVGTTQEFKYSADSWTIQEMNDPTAPCTNGNATYTNRVLVVPAADTTLPVVCWSSCYGCTVDVTLKVNMAWEVANNAISADSVHVAGDFQGWNPGATVMTDADNDGIYEVTINVPANSSIQYKFINGNAWGTDESVPAACSVAGTANRGATFAYGDSTLAPVCFGKCTDCMASLDEALQNVSLFPNPTRGQFNLARMDAASEVEVSVLDLQGKVLTVATWNAGSESLGIDLSSFANGVYMVRLTSEEGSRTLRVSVQK